MKFIDTSFIDQKSLIDIWSATARLRIFISSIILETEYFAHFERFRNLTIVQNPENIAYQNILKLLVQLQYVACAVDYEFRGYFWKTK